jgi:hypothetical protein
VRRGSNRAQSNGESEINLAKKEERVQLTAELYRGVAAGKKDRGTAEWIGYARLLPPLTKMI